MLLDLYTIELALGHLEAALAAANTLSNTAFGSDVPPTIARETNASFQQATQDNLGAWQDALAYDERMSEFTTLSLNQYMTPVWAADFALVHDARAARAMLKRPSGLSDAQAMIAFNGMGTLALPQFMAMAAVDDWTDAARDLSSVDSAMLKAGALDDVRHTLIWPWLAYAEARTGKLRAGQLLVAMTPLDCNLSLRMRGRIAELAGDRPTAAAWFARADADAPSFPFAVTDWGTMLLHHGDADGAIAKFAEAHRRVPHYADALELWGEALVSKNRSDLALAKFEEVARYAPNWGRLHLEWGEALLWLGRKAEAKNQFGIAAGLDLNPDDRRTLSRLKPLV